MTNTATKMNKMIDDVAIVIEDGIDIYAHYLKVAYVDIPSTVLKTTVKIIDFPFELAKNTFAKMEQQRSESTMMTIKCYNLHI